MKWFKEHKFLGFAAVVTGFFLLVHFHYIEKEDVRTGFHDLVDFQHSVIEFYHDVALSDSEHKALHARERREKADERLNNHLDSLINKKKE